MQKNNS